MTTRILGQPVLRIVVIVGLIALTLVMLLASRASGQEPRTLDLEIIFTEDSFEVARAEGSEISGDLFLDRGDIFSGQAAVYRAGETDGDRIGTFYFTASVTAEGRHADTAANHMLAHGYFELFGEGTLTVTGLVNFMNPYTVTISGGTGDYVDASGHCRATQTEENEAWYCTIQ